MVPALLLNTNVVRKQVHTSSFQSTAQAAQAADGLSLRTKEQRLQLATAATIKARKTAPVLSREADIKKNLQLRYLGEQCQVALYSAFWQTPDMHGDSQLMGRHPWVELHWAAMYCCTCRGKGRHLQTALETFDIARSVCRRVQDHLDVTFMTFPINNEFGSSTHAAAENSDHGREIAC